MYRYLSGGSKDGARHFSLLSSDGMRGVKPKQSFPLNLRKCFLTVWVAGAGCPEECVLEYAPLHGSNWLQCNFGQCSLRRSLPNSNILCSYKTVQ